MSEPIGCPGCGSLLHIHKAGCLLEKREPLTSSDAIHSTAPKETKSESGLAGAVTAKLEEDSRNETLTPPIPSQASRPATLDAGHRYRLLTLDGDIEQVLTFVKRHDIEKPERFPGNTNSYPGTTLQSVIRALIDRTTYLQGQIPCEENISIINNLHNCLYLLEHRAMRRHGLDANQLTQHKASFGAMCARCGHVLCACNAPLILWKRRQGAESAGDLEPSENVSPPKAQPSAAAIALAEQTEKEQNQ